MNINYEEVYESLRDYLCKRKPLQTNEITKEIKDFFNIENHNKLGIFSRTKNEYLTDVHITSFNPIDVVKKNTLDVIPETIESILTVESELGGSSASSAYGVMKNVVEDFCKLLLIYSKYKILIFTSLKYSHENENDYILNRVNTLKDIYEKSSAEKNNNGVLLIHIKGKQPNSTQVQVEINEESIKGYIIYKNNIKELNDE